jgi:hypothetical protein
VSLENAESHPTSARPHSRGRAQTIGTGTNTVADQLRAAQDHYKDAMGNEQSSQKGHHRGKEREREKEKEKEQPRHATPPQPAAAAAATAAAAPQPIVASQQAHQLPEVAPAPAPALEPDAQAPAEPPHTLPVDVPAPSSREDARTDVQDGGASSIDPADASQDYLIPSSQFSRPPRLPLPIEEEVHTPGSPIISPQENLWSPLYEGEVEGTLPRRSSMLSTTTADDEDLGEEFKGPSTGRPTVPTLIEWEGPGERVYVTGTFAGWNRKYRLHRK